MSNRAWVTLATNDSYGLGALVLAHSLRRVGSAHPAVVLITPSVTDAMKERLSAVFAEVVTVNVLDSGDAAHLALLQRPELGITFTKIHCWNLTQYEKCVFLDADALVVQHCDELFEREELSAAPDVGWPDCFNSGVFVFKPSSQTFQDLIKFAQERGSFDGGDQGLLNSYFSDWAHGDINKHLPFLYNVTSAAFYSYLPALKQFGQDLKIIHFIGTSKPWLQPYRWETREVEAPAHIRGLLQLWWDIFVCDVHAQLDTTMVESEELLATEAVEALPELPPQDTQQHYEPTVDPQSEFYWHHPQNQISNEDNLYIETQQFYDPWERYKGNIPSNHIEERVEPDTGRSEEIKNLINYSWQHQPQELMKHTESMPQDDTWKSEHHHTYQQKAYNNDQHQNQFIDYHQNQHEDNHYERQHAQNYHYEHKSNENCHHTEAYSHENNFRKPEQLQNQDNSQYSHNHHHEYTIQQQYDTYSHHHHHKVDPQYEIKHHQVEQVLHVHSVQNRKSKNHRHRRRLNRIDIPPDTYKNMNGNTSDTESDDYVDIRPRHPYDDFYLRHRATVDARGRKVCSHEIPPTPSPSPPPGSPPPLEEAPLFPLNGNGLNGHNFESEDDTGVAGNLARVVPGTSGAREAVDELTRRQGWEAGNIDYMGADSFDNIWAKISQTLNQPRISPPKSIPKEPTPPPKQPSPPKEVPIQQEPQVETKQVEESKPTVEVSAAPLEVEVAKEAVEISEPKESAPVTEAAEIPKPTPAAEAEPSTESKKVAKSEAPAPAPESAPTVAPSETKEKTKQKTEQAVPATPPATPISSSGSGTPVVETVPLLGAPAEAIPSAVESPAVQVSEPTPVSSAAPSEPSTPANTEAAPKLAAVAAAHAPSDSPPLANTPAKEDPPAAPDAKSDERRKPGPGRLALCVGAGSADPAPTPDSELEDAAALASAIIAGELAPQPPAVTPAPPQPPASPPAPQQPQNLAVAAPELPTPPVGAVSLAQIGVKPKEKATTAAQLESSLKGEPGTPTTPAGAGAEGPKKKVVKKSVKKEGPSGETPVPPPRKKEKKPKDK